MHQKQSTATVAVYNMDGYVIEPATVPMFLCPPLLPAPLGPQVRPGQPMISGLPALPGQPLAPANPEPHRQDTPDHRRPAPRPGPRQPAPPAVVPSSPSRSAVTCSPSSARPMVVSSYPTRPAVVSSSPARPAVVSPPSARPIVVSSSSVLPIAASSSAARPAAVSSSRARPTVAPFYPAASTAITTTTKQQTATPTPSPKRRPTWHFFSGLLADPDQLCAVFMRMGTPTRPVRQAYPARATVDGVALRGSAVLATSDGQHAVLSEHGRAAEQRGECVAISLEGMEGATEPEQGIYDGKVFGVACRGA